ncbi:conserved exported protein of unknown function [Candidatus Filomicrobium marinum]|uniref:Lipoprotein n=2 Tax=Filomicrobium TaxID=119044 RepID=A0A0D6JIX7_9HYPH|nr:MULTISPECIES: hypothetical protein [Filomicrobium]MCV0369236.1 hypothetical protein [Filomicrobium sp.]CFX37997.1 conserved exported protein of unknown function [Candidatus Filomicrobium marinum]CPR21565.1 conserved exported protein of unknown function [Candidatus Filomicrobium marinum]SDP61702.1 hypothetical protein SAMN04488061_3486 [Filomicrobium insigne]
MYQGKLVLGLLLGSALALGGCAADGTSLLTTGSLGGNETKVAESDRISPECMKLMAKIQELRQEGTPDRVEKISSGKSSTVNIKRSALAKLTELDKANSEFQLKCSKLAPTTAAAATPAPAAGATAAPAKQAATTATNTQQAAAAAQ